MRTVNNTNNDKPRTLLLWSTICLLVIILAENIAIVKGYPMLVEVAENSERCIRLNVPEDDDAHMVFLALPSPASIEPDKKTPNWIKNYNPLESHFLGQMQELTKRRTETSGLLRKFPVKPSSDVQSSMDNFLESFDGTLASGCKVKMSNPKSTTSRNMDTYWFTPLVVNHIRSALRNREKDREKSPLEGYMACFTNNNADFAVNIVVDSVLTSEGPAYDDENASEDVNFQGHHLTPLAEQLDQSLTAAKTVINEMNFMERREQRMRVTADSINSRVRYFSYISVGVLLVVTYLQVSYLKRYFRKKKLL